MRRGLLVALAVTVAVNLGVLVGVARNRAGTPDAALLLDERELVLERAPRENSVVALRWNLQSDHWPGIDAPAFAPPWLDRGKLEALGFDCSVRPGDPGAQAFYSGALPRRAVVAFELGGERWREALAAWQRHAAEDVSRLLAARTLSPEVEPAYRAAVATAPERFSRLVPVDVDVDPETLRARYPDATRYLLLAAVVRVRHEPGRQGGGGPSVRGHVVQVFPERLIVGREVRGPLGTIGPTPVVAPHLPLPGAIARIAHPPRYEVRLTVGRLLQPWVVEVRPTTAVGPSR
jgi:hypothetical protein